MHQLILSWYTPHYHTMRNVLNIKIMQLTNYITSLHQIDIITTIKEGSTGLVQNKYNIMKNKDIL